MVAATSTYLALAAAAAAAGTSYYNAQNTARKQDDSAAASIRNQNKQQERADQKIADLVKANQGSNSQDEQAQFNNAYLQTLQQGSQKSGFNQGAGGFSDVYRQDVANAAKATDQYGVDRAGLLSRIDAPTEQRRNEGVMFDDTRNSLLGIDRDAKQQAFLDQLKLSSIKENPWLGALSAGLSGYAGAAGGFKGGGGQTGFLSGDGSTAFGYVPYGG